ncbi:hypothetical protein ZWY2020_040555 [Hordeum vulgare]|nr:hypothetical protein ZWY2020_040555 [Hordeum vulgare]
MALMARREPRAPSLQAPALSEPREELLRPARRSLEAAARRAGWAGDVATGVSLLAARPSKVLEFLSPIYSGHGICLSLAELKIKRGRLNSADPVHASNEPTAVEVYSREV